MKIKPRTVVLRVRQSDRDIFEAIKNGKKKVETRAATVRYINITVGTIARFVCGKDRFEKQIVKVQKFKSVAGLLKVYKPTQINPICKTAAELQSTYDSFPAYKEKIKQFGLIALELE